MPTQEAGRQLVHYAYSPNGYPGGEGTRVLAVCAMHPDEEASQDMLELLRERARNNELPPGLNFIVGNGTAHLDGRGRYKKHNMYRIFPGDPRSPDPEVRRAAYLCSLATQYDIVLDIHGLNPERLHTTAVCPPFVLVNPAASYRTLSIAGHLSGVRYPDLGGGRVVAAAKRHFAGACKNVITVELTPGDSIFSPHTLIDEMEAITLGAQYELRDLQWYQHAGSVSLDAAKAANVSGQRLPYETIPPVATRKFALPPGSAVFVWQKKPILDSDGVRYAGEVMMPLGTWVRPPEHILS